MFNRIRKLFSTRTDNAAAIEALKGVKKHLERMNIPVVADDIDAGYDMAIDEAIDLIDDHIRALSTP